MGLSDTVQPSVIAEAELGFFLVFFFLIRPGGGAPLNFFALTSPLGPVPKGVKHLKEEPEKI